MLNKDEIAKLLGVSTVTIDRWRDKGLPCIKIGNIIRFEQEVVENWMKENSEA